MINFLNPQRFVSVATSLALAGSGTIAVSGSGTMSVTEPIALAGSGTIALSGTGTISTTENVALAGSGTIALGGTGTISTTENVALSGSGTIALGGTGTVSVVEHVALTGSGTIALGGTGTLSTTDNVALTGSGTIALGGTGTISTTENVALTGSGTIALGGTGTLSTTEPLALAGSGTIALGGTGTLSTTEPLALAGSGTIALGGTGTVSVIENVALSGSGTIALGGTGTATVTSPDYEQEVSEITSLKGWFDANKPNGTDQSGFTNGTAVTTWTSRVGTSVTLGQSTASAKPTWNTGQINSLPAIDFAVGDWLNSTSTDIKDIVHGQNSIAITTYVVMQVDNYPSSSASGDAMVLGWEDTSTTVGSQDVFHLPRIERGTGYLQLLERAGGTGLTNLAGYEYQTALGTGSYKYFGCIAGATSITLRVGGSEQTMSNYLGGTWNTAQTHDAHQLQVGGFSNAGGSQILLDGKIAEILIFNSTLGSTEIASVEGYIKYKYNL